MRNSNLPSGFSPFSWAIAMFCLPVLLWPLALLISPNLLNNPNLSDSQIHAMSVFLWGYPFVLGIIARILYKLHERKPTLARQGLTISAVIFYGVLFYVAVVGFN
ncbi:hypothetical protein SC936_07670 [Aggregatibacter actinomycetemcomitans serotype e str. SC936]|uniref:DUF5389 domain-containing protein n=1 Tax=Aggregatibacter actinomycetemcomitans TaxID=714 RepID=UPI000798131C|nr:DUF5389 domain-containing protein [Aggregatibacter actinomycetemcomitans]KYK79619.1 hypothetical protein SC936_07670 [Aggregatibacter actinomycetemcomitans serotype e str. SC936]